MNNLHKTMISTAAGLAALGIAASVALAQGGIMGDHQGTAPGMMEPGMQQMPGQGMGPGMMSGGQGKVEQVDEDTIVAEIVTVDNSLVQRFEVDRHNGDVQPDTGEQEQQQSHH